MCCGTTRASAGATKSLWRRGAFGFMCRVLALPPSASLPLGSMMAAAGCRRRRRLHSRRWMQQLRTTHQPSCACTPCARSQCQRSTLTLSAVLSPSLISSSACLTSAARLPSSPPPPLAPLPPPRNYATATLLRTPQCDGLSTGHALVCGVGCHTFAGSHCTLSRAEIRAGSAGAVPRLMCLRLVASRSATFSIRCRRRREVEAWM
jgi:hypothetical protein